MSKYLAHYLQCKTKLRVGIIYRHPSPTKIDKFLDDLSACLSDSTSSNKTVYFGGDKNFNLDKLNQTTFTFNYINILISNRLLPFIMIPTKVTATSSTIVDHINTNDLRHEVISFVLKSLITDHYITISCVKNLKLALKM